MKSLNDLRSLYQEKNTQFVLLNQEGEIIDSDNILFDASLGISIQEVHPFFISLLSSETEDTITFTCVHLEINEKLFICDVSFKKLDDHRFLLILTDFSEHYNSFQSLAQSRNETAIGAELIELDNYLLSKKEAFKNNFIANFNHELVSPIQSILAFSDVLKKTHLSHEQKDYLEIITDSSIALKSMVNDIFDLSKIETGNLDITNNRFSFKRFIKVIREEYMHKCKSSGLNFKTIYADDMPTYIVSDKLRLRQIITNLLDNAIKFTPKGTITISIEQEYRRGRKLTFSIKVIDTGIGIDSKYYDFIFGRFNRLEHSKPTIGNGLGLAIARDIVKLMDGEIHVKSEVNTGSVFTATVRTTTPLIDREQKQTLKTKENSEERFELLLVEDNYADQLSLFKILAQSKRYFIDIAMDGNEAIKLQKQKHYDFIVMNYNSKLTDGFEAAKIINANPKKITPILILTGLKIDEKIRLHYQPYFKDILYKPFQAECLIETITLHIN
jgi:signal transduction histidine kinase